MASAWGKSWGKSWGNSWGAVGSAAPAPPAAAATGSGGEDLQPRRPADGQYSTEDLFQYAIALITAGVLEP